MSNQGSKAESTKDKTSSYVADDATQSKDKWTPGPWTIQERKDRRGALPNRNSLEIVHNYHDGGGQQVIIGKHTGIDCLTRENAEFITRACNNHTAMLEALKLAKVRLEGGSEAEQALNAGIVKVIKQAIAHAEGNE